MMERHIHIIHFIMSIMYLWAIIWNVALVFIIVIRKSLRKDGHKTLVIATCLCFLLEAILVLFLRVKDMSSDVTSWLAEPGVCVSFRTLILAIKILIPYSIVLLSIDLCLQLKDPPFYAPSIKRSICMVLCNWTLAVAVTFLLLFGVGKFENTPELDWECHVVQTFLYDVMERCLVFLFPAMTLLLTVISIQCLRCKKPSITSSRYGIDPDIDVIAHAERASAAVSGIIIFFLLLWIPYNAIYTYKVFFVDNFHKYDGLDKLLFFLEPVSHLPVAIVPVAWILLDKNIRASCCD